MTWAHGGAQKRLADAGPGPWPGPGEPFTAATVARAYREHHGAVYGLAVRLCGPACAEDVTQEVFLQFWRNPERYRPERGSLRTFLLTIAHNRAVDMLRSTEARRRREGRSANESAGAPDDVEELVEHADSNRQIRQALDSLPRREKDAIVTAFYGACTYREAAVVLGVAEGTTKSRIRSGLRRLATALEEAELIGSS